METRQAYSVRWEDERTAAWRRGELEEPHSPWLEEHRARCRERIAMGRHTMRVRFVELPMTEYTEREFAWGYPGNSAAGEEIFVIDRAEHPEFDHVREDFVVFDDASIMYYRYTDDDALTGYDYSDDPVVVAEHVELADRVLAAATPFPEWSAVHPGVVTRGSRL